MKQTTLNFLIRDDHILLAMKKRGFGVGKWNGVGGKVNPGERVGDAIVRETEEEIGVRIHVEDLEPAAILHFHFTSKPDWDQECHVFLTRTWEGEPVETEEMRPQWYPQDNIPYDAMWVDDPYWLPRVLAGEKVVAEFHFTGDGSAFETWKVEEWK